MSLIITNVLVSALTSGVVALGIEWLFKPRLEARKERLLEGLRKRRTFEEQMLTIMVDLAKWSTIEYPKDMPEEVAARLDQDKAAAEARIDGISLAMNDELKSVALGFATSHNRDLIIRYTFAVRLVQLSDRTLADKQAIQLELTQAAHTWLFNRPWRMIRRVRAMLQLEQSLDKLSGVVLQKPADEN